MAISPIHEADIDAGYRRLARLVRDVVGEQAAESVLARAAMTLRELVRCEDVVVWEATGDGGLVVVLAEGEDEAQMRGMRIRLGEGLTGLAAMTGEAIVSDDAHLDARAGWVPGTAQVPEAVAAMPLAARDQLLGALSLYRRGNDRSVSEVEIELLADFAAVVALALANAYGHDRGDAALQLVAAVIQHGVRAGDIAARVGGDEFVVVLPRTNRADADRLAAEIAAAITYALAPYAASASVGVSTLREQPDDLLAEADRLLYQAKRAHPAPHSIRLQLSTPGEHAPTHLRPALQT
jgi:GGDEF domain-containing protein